MKNKEDLLYSLWLPEHRRYRGLREHYTEVPESAGLFSWEEAHDQLVEMNATFTDVPTEVMVPSVSDSFDAADIPDDDTPVLIWSEEHRGWWRENSWGYTPNRKEAGVYLFSEALDIVVQANRYSGSDEPHEGIVTLDAYPDLLEHNMPRNIWGRQ